MKIVQFKNGSYGVRKWSFFSVEYQFLDLRHPNFFWGKTSEYINDCEGSLKDVEKALKKFNEHKEYLKDIGKPV